MPRRARLVLLAAFALIALACLRLGLRAVPPSAITPGPTPEFKPKVWDYPGHNFW